MGAAAAAAGGAQALGAGLQMYGAFQQGKAAKTEGEIRAIRFQTLAEAGRTRAVQIQGAYAEELNQSLGNIVGITAAQGRGVDSATTRALLDKAETLSNRASFVAASNERIRALGADSDAAAARRAGDEAMRASYLKMVKPGLEFIQGVRSTF